ncbi:MAG: transcriptional repressor [Eubacteriales bacterium]|nr:transcriptional repressor [Eubacteriales bacterium]
MTQRNTIQRTLVLDAVRQLHNHATAEEIYQSVVKLHPSVSRATVYRNLSRLVDDGEIRRLEIPNEPDRFDHLCHQHYHVKCVKCQRIFDVDMEYLGEIESKIKDSHGFDIVGHDLVFWGICPECKNSK